MTRAGRDLAWVLAVVLAAGLPACGEDGDSTEDAQTEDVAPGDALDMTDATEDPDAAGDPVEEDPAADTTEEDPGRDCEGMYPSGPFGWKGSIRENTSGLYWDGHGDYLDNIYLLNQDDEPTLPAMYYCSSEIDVLFYDFTAMWCPPCNAAASEENAFIAWMETHGWNVAFMSVLEEDSDRLPADRADAETWKTMHGIHSPVMYDPMRLYSTAPFRDTWPEEDARGWPTFMVVNPDNMMIWYAFSGWRGSTPQETFFNAILEIFEMGAANDPEYLP